MRRNHPNFTLFTAQMAQYCGLFTACNGKNTTLTRAVYQLLLLLLAIIPQRSSSFCDCSTPPLPRVIFQQNGQTIANCHSANGNSASPSGSLTWSRDSDHQRQPCHWLLVSPWHPTTHQSAPLGVIYRALRAGTLKMPSNSGLLSGSATPEPLRTLL